MRLSSYLVTAAMLVSCGGGQRSGASYPPRTERTDALIADKSDEDAISALAIERDRLKKEVESTPFAPEVIRRRDAAELAYAQKLLDQHVDAYAAGLIAQSKEDPFSVVQSATDFILLRHSAVTPEQLARVRSSLEPAAAVHEKRGREISDAYPYAKRLHTARAMLLRRKGDLALDATLVAPSTTAMRVTVTGVECPIVEEALRALQPATLPERTADLAVNITQCKVKVVEDKKTEELAWIEEVQIDKEWVVTRSEQVCGKGKVSAGSETCTRQGNDLVCKKNTYDVQGGCEMVPVDGYWKPVIEKRPQKGTRVSTQHTYSFDIKAPWTATYKGKKLGGTLIAQHFAIFVNAPALGTHEELRAPLPAIDAVLRDKVGPKSHELAGEAAALFSDETASARASAAATTPGNLDAEEEAACKVVMLGGEVPLEVAERYRLRRGDILDTLRWPIRDGLVDPFSK
jgi:hypothetical protein